MTSLIGFFIVLMKETGKFITPTSKFAILHFLYIQAKKMLGDKNKMRSCAELW